MIAKTTMLVMVWLAVCSAGLSAAPATLADGTAIEIGRPGAKVYVVSPDGRRYPLWNGVFSLRSGARLTIRGGVLSSTPQFTDGGRDARDSCLILVERVCGREQQCGDSTACDLARQLQTIEAGAQASQPPRPPGAGGSQCDKALRDSGYFKPCRW